MIVHMFYLDELKSLKRINQRFCLCIRVVIVWTSSCNENRLFFSSKIIFQSRFIYWHLSECVDVKWWSLVRVRNWDFVTEQLLKINWKKNSNASVGVWSGPSVSYHTVSEQLPVGCWGKKKRSKCETRGLKTNRWRHCGSILGSDPKVKHFGC